MDIQISIRSFGQFTVAIIPVTKKKIDFGIEKVHVSSKTEVGRYHFLVNKRERKPTLSLFKIEINDQEKNDKLTELWTSTKLVTKKIRAKLGRELLGIFDNTKNILYIYDLIEENYSGFIDLKKVIPQIKSESSHYHDEYISDMMFSRNHAKGSLVLYYNDSIFMFSQINVESLDSIQEEAWTLIHKFDNVLSLKEIKSVKIYESYYGKILFVINNKYFLSKTRFLTEVSQDALDNDISSFENEKKRKVTFEGLFTIFQQSKPIYHPQLLKQLFLKGHMNLILKILVKLNELLNSESKKYKIPSFCEIPLDLIVKELTVETVESPKKAAQPKQTETAASLFDDFAWNNDKKEEKKPLFGTKKEEKKRDPNVKLTIEEEFEDIKDDLVKIILNPKMAKVNLSEKSVQDLIRFIKVFAKIYKTEYDSDKLTYSLLRKFEYDKQYSTVNVKEDDEEEFDIGMTAAQRILSNIKAEESGQNLEPWTTMQIAFAYHSKDQDVIYNQIKDDNLDWETMNKLSVPIWIKDTEKLKSLLEIVAKKVYRDAGNDVGIKSRAQVTALYYIMAGKKNMLVNLYRTEPANKKVHDLLVNDFSLPKFQKKADKNAMALISKKNYELGIAFFILANKIKDAITMALTKLHDLNLAICIARLVEGYESEKCFELIDKYLIAMGKETEDPWLVSIGYWWKKQYIDSVNTISGMIGETKDRLSQKVFDMGGTFNLYKPNAVIKTSSEEEKSSKKDPKANKQKFLYPIISGRNAFVLDYIHHLMDHHIVKREIKKAQFQESSSEEEDGDLFDDFFGGGGGAKQKEEKKKEEVKSIEVDKEALLSIISDSYADKGFGILGLVLAYENKDIKMKHYSANNLSKHIIIEVVKGTQADNDDSIKRVSKAISELESRFLIDKEEYFIFVRNQYRFLDNLRLEFRFIQTDKDASTLLFRLEDELLKAINFINVMTSYPFCIDLEKSADSISSILSLIEFLEGIVKCMFIYENEVNEDVEPEPFEEAKHLDENLDKMRPPSNTVNAPSTSINSSTNSKRAGMFKVRSTISKKKPGNQIQNEDSEYMAQLCCKLRTSFLLHLCMILLSFLIKKFEYIRPLLFDLRKLMNYTNNRAIGKEIIDDGETSIYNLQSLANIQIYLKNIKEISHSLLVKSGHGKGTSDKVLNPEYSDEEDANDPYLRDFRKPEEEEKKEEVKTTPDDKKKKMKQFLVLWFRQIVIYNTYYVLHLSMTNHNMTSILDVKPSIVKATNIKYALTSLMNPRLQSYQQVNNFKSMKRILDNIVTYFFQNFLSVEQRYLVSEDLREISHNNNKIAI